jgi:hypothetical protein
MNRELYDKSYAFFEEQLKQYSPEVVKEWLNAFFKKYIPNQK